MKKLDFTKYTPEEINKRFAASETVKRQWDSKIKDCYRYMIPNRNGYNTTQAQDDSKYIFDSTAEKAITSFAAMMQSALTPSWTQWASFVAGQDVPPKLKGEYNKQLATISRTVMEHIWYSNFDSQVLEMYYDLAIGTGAMLIHNTNDPSDPLRFESVPLNEIYPEEGAYGDIDTIFRKFSVANRNIKQRWSKATFSAKLSESIDKHPDTKTTVIEGVIYNDKKKSYTYNITIAGEVVYEIGLESSPWVVPRWDTRSGEVLGRGPAFNALSDVKTLNQVKKYTLMNAEMAVSNIYTAVDDGTVNLANITLEPNTIIPVKSNGGELGATLAPLPRSGDFNVGNLVIKDLQSEVREAFFVDQLGGIQNAPVRSATEIQIRTNQMLAKAGALFGRLQTEFVNKLMKRVYFVLSENGIVPAELKVDNKMLSVKVDSPLATTRKQEELNSYLGFLQTAAQINPNAPALLVKPSNITWIAEMMGVPLDQVPTTEELTESLKALAQQMQQQQQSQEVQ